VKLLPDSNVWVAAFATRGLCADLLRLALRRHGRAGFELLTCAQVREETLRILRDKLGASTATLSDVRTAMVMARDVPPADWQPPADFPDPDDVPIVGAALVAGAELLVTGDRALLALACIDGLAIVTPRTAYQRLLDLT
jgi:predicted nucleic acid-binding protein